MIAKFDFIAIKWVDWSGFWNFWFLSTCVVDGGDVVVTVVMKKKLKMNFEIIASNDGELNGINEFMKEIDRRTREWGRWGENVSNS